VLILSQLNILCTILVKQYFKMVRFWPTLFSQHRVTLNSRKETTHSLTHHAVCCLTLCGVTLQICLYSWSESNKE